MLKVVIFDWDGTLNNSMESVYNAYSVHSGKPLDYIRKHFNPDWKAFIKEEKIPDMSYEEWEKLVKKFGTKFFSGAADCIKKLKKDGFTLAIASSSPMRSILDKLKEEKLLDYFTTIVSADMVKRLKPDPEALNKVMKELGVKADECVLVGDSCVDSIAADSVDMRFIGVSWGFQCLKDLEKIESVKIVHNFEELYDLIKGL